MLEACTVNHLCSDCSLIICMHPWPHLVPFRAWVPFRPYFVGLSRFAPFHVRIFEKLHALFLKLISRQVYQGIPSPLNLISIWWQIPLELKPIVIEGMWFSRNLMKGASLTHFRHARLIKVNLKTDKLRNWNLKDSINAQIRKNSVTRSQTFRNPLKNLVKLAIPVRIMRGIFQPYPQSLLQV